MIIKEIEYYFPKRKISYDELDKKNPSWKMSKTRKITGIENLYVSDKNETSLDLAVKAIKKLKNFKIFKKKIDGLIFCTQTPNQFIPSNSSILHGLLGLNENCFTLDISHGCSGFVYGLSIANQLINSKSCSNIMLINADTYSKIIDPNDRMTKVIFSDAASVVLLSKDNRDDLFYFSYGSSGKNYQKLSLDAEAFSFKKRNKFLKMDGMGIMSFVNSKVPKQIKSLIDKNKLKKNDIKFYIFHQASKIALDSLVRIMEIDKRKVIYDLQNGNTVSASIPIVIKKLIKSKRIRRGDLLCLSGFGVGLSWSSAIIKF